LPRCNYEITDSFDELSQVAEADNEDVGDDYLQKLEDVNDPLQRNEDGNNVAWNCDTAIRVVYAELDRYKAMEN
jgi:hypothetical protein